MLAASGRDGRHGDDQDGHGQVTSTTVTIMVTTTPMPTPNTTPNDDPTISGNGVDIGNSTSPMLPTLPDFGHGTRLAASLNGGKKAFSFSPRWSENEARRM